MPCSVPTLVTADSLPTSLDKLEVPAPGTNRASDPVELNEESNWPFVSDL